MNFQYINEEENEYFKESKHGLLRFGPEIIREIRKEHQIDNRENREKIISIIDEWIKQQDHFVKKNFSKAYIEKAIINSKGSIERAKQQLDRMCTFKTLMPEYFQVSNIKNDDFMAGFAKAQFGFSKQLTDEYYRVIILKMRPNTVLDTSDFTLLYKFFTIVCEYMTVYDYSRGYFLICDFIDSNASELLKLNFAELQQFFPIITAGYGIKLKGVYFLTSSKIIESFLNALKRIFSPKIASRIHAFSSREALRATINGDVLPKEYGGPDKTIDELHEEILESFTAAPVQKYFAEMNKATTDETKRQKYEFNDQHMGMTGTFRTLSLD